MADKGFAQAVCVDVVRRLRETRERRKISKYALAQQSGVSESMVGLVERGLRNPTLETLLKLSEALEVDLGSAIQAARDSIRKP